MSTVNSTNEVPGDVTNAVSVNTKFANVATASGAINEENVRSEGVDRRTLESYTGGRREPLVFVDYDDRDNSAATVHPNQTGEGFVTISNVLLDLTASPLTVTAGDLVRIHFTAFLTGIDDGQYATWGAAGSDSGGPNRSFNPADAIGIVFFPMWRIANPGSFVPLTNEADLNTTLVSPADIVINDSTDKTDSIAFCSMEGYLDSGNCVSAREVHGTWNYIHTGANVTIYEVNLNFRGPMVYEYNGASRVLHSPIWNAGRYDITCMDIPQSPTNRFGITVGNAQLSIMVMRGDS